MNPAQTIEEIDAHRQKEVLALVPYLDGALRRDVKSVAAALMADLEEYLKKQLEVVKAGGRILEGMHVLAAGDGAKKGVVIRDCGASNNEPYTVRWGDGEESGWLKPADIVLDEAAEERHKEKVKELEEKLEERQAQWFIETTLAGSVSVCGMVNGGNILQCASFSQEAALRRKSCAREGGRRRRRRRRSRRRRRRRKVEEEEVYASPGCFAHPGARTFWLGGVCKGRRA